MELIQLFTSPEVPLGAKLLEVLYIVMGLISIYTGVKNFKDEQNTEKLGTAIFWIALGVVVAFGRAIPAKVNGILIIVMTLPAVFKKVKPGYSNPIVKEKSEECAEKIGLKLFIPALCLGIFALLTALFTDLGALVGVGIGVFVSMLILMLYNKENKPNVFLEDARRMLDIMGPLNMLPMLLASLGAVFTEAGVGTAVASIVGKVIPQGNMTIGIIVFAIGMALFTMIMGNAFAAITVMTVGIGVPFVLELGADPVVIGSLALTCGFCGTLITPMAANFNIVPVALLEMKDKNTVIKIQFPMAVIMLIVQIIMMLILK